MTMTIAEIETKLDHHRTVLTQGENKITDLRSQRAKLALADTKKNKTKIAALDRQIRQLTVDLQNKPAEIELLKSNLEDATKKQKQAEHNKLLAAQKKAAKQIESLSQELVDALKIAMDANDKLKAAFDQYNRFKKQTNESCISKNVTRGSVDMLKWVYDFCRKELSGEHVMRTSMPIGCPQV